MLRCLVQSNRDGDLPSSSSSDSTGSLGVGVAVPHDALSTFWNASKFEGVDELGIFPLLLKSPRMGDWKREMGEGMMRSGEWKTTGAVEDERFGSEVTNDSALV